MLSARASQRAFVAGSVALFVASTALTIAWCGSMSAMHEMPMPGDWSMSMTWMRMPGQTWPGAAMEFLVMWTVMMIAMMLPSLAPMLMRYRRALAPSSTAHRDALTVLVGSAYFIVWSLFGALVFAAGAALASFEMRWPPLARAVPLAIGATVLAAGVSQFSAWKARDLACCRGTHGCCAPPAGAYGAWRYGLRLGMHCVRCCFGLTLVLLVIGVMDLRAMALVTAAISVERLAPDGECAARLLGAVLIALGMVMLARAAVA